LGIAAVEVPTNKIWGSQLGIAAVMVEVSTNKILGNNLQTENISFIFIKQDHLIYIYDILLMVIASGVIRQEETTLATL